MHLIEKYLNERERMSEKPQKTRKRSRQAVKPASDAYADTNGQTFGRPTVYRDNYPAIAQGMCELGATDEQIAKALNVCVATLHNWMNTKPDFLEAFKVGKAPNDDRTERTLYQRAMGYSYETEKVFNYKGEIVRAKVTEHVPPDVASLIFWLKNRRPDVWRDRKDVEFGGKVTLESAALSLLDDVAEEAEQAGAPLIDADIVPE
jgi:hypothetical protein